jgi:hypothetical protein
MPIRRSAGRARGTAALDIALDVYDARRDVAAAVARNPLLSCGVALGAGYLLGSLGGQYAKDERRARAGLARAVLMGSAAIFGRRIGARLLAYID